MFTGFLTCTVKTTSEIHRQKQLEWHSVSLATVTVCTWHDRYTCQIFLVIKVFQMLQKAKTHAIPLGNHMTQQKLTETTENPLALTKTPNVGIFRFIPVYSALFGCHSASFLCHSGSFRYIPVPFLFISFHSGVIPVLFRSFPFRL